LSISSNPVAPQAAEGNMSSKPKIRVLIVDDHDMVRQGLSVFIEAFPDLELVGQAANGAEAVKQCAALSPDVVLMDLKMPVMDGVEATRAIRAAHPGIQVVALTSYKDEELVQGVLEAGAIGYTLKNASIDDLAEIVRASYEGKPRLDPEAAKVLIKAVTRPLTPRYNLSPRELEVLEEMVKGCSNPEIADTLIVSRATVKFHVSSILSKMNVDSRTEAVALAIQHKLVKTDG
jgi:two-component system, NarL family, response regulator LiaR